MMQNLDPAGFGDFDRSVSGPNIYNDYLPVALSGLYRKIGAIAIVYVASRCDGGPYPC